MPTTRPRYTFTDTGSLRALLDAAQRRWPEVASRKELLLRLAETGREALLLRDSRAAAERSRERQRAALSGLRDAVDWGAIRDDQAWR